MRVQRRTLTALLLLALPQVALAQQKPTLKPADYGKWESLGLAILSPDGQHTAYSVSRTSGQNELRIQKIGEAKPKVVAFGVQPAFSNDSKWVAYGVTVSEEQREALTRQRKPVRNKLGLQNLATGEVTTFEDIQSFTFSDDGRYLAMRGYSAEGQKHRGVDLVVRDLAAGTNTTFGNISAYAWRDKGTLLAMTIDAANRAANGVQLFDPASGALKTLESGDATYAGLSWRKNDDDLALLKSAVHEAYEDTSNVVLAFRDLATLKSSKKVFDHTKAAGYPVDMRVVDFRTLQWSDDGATLFFGIKARDKKPPKAPVMAANGSADNTQMKASQDSARKPAEELAGVEIWHSKDVDIIPTQKVRANQDRNFNYLAAWHLTNDKFVQLGDDLTEEVVLPKGQKIAIGRDGTPYDNTRMFSFVYQDLYAIDVATGQKKKLQDKAIADGGLRLPPSSTGRYSVTVRDNHYWVTDLGTGSERNITKDVPASFINTNDDHTVPHKPTYGNAGWTKGDRSILLYDEFDVWDVPVDGSKATRLTSGAENKIRYRLMRLDPEEESFDLSKSIYFGTYGEWTKKSGIARKDPGKPVVDLLFQDKNISGLRKAKSSETYAYIVQSYDDSPDLFVGGPDLASARQVSETNPFQKDYAWTRSELVNYKNKQGVDLQAALNYPANYDPSKKYPLIVYFYEKTSNTHHQYNVPSERSTYNPAVWTQNGYFVLRPDIVYRDRNPGLSAVDALVPAVEAAVAKGGIDKDKVGIVGHSWGGYQTAFVPTQTNIFKAAVAGAPLTDLISMYLSIYWNTGGTDARIFEISQGRMEVPPWEDLDSYMKNSALFNITKLNTPMLVEFGDKDGAVDWHQGIELYNAARRAQKDLVLLVYEGENHGLAQKKNQIDYHRRINEWFDHYLKGTPAPKWITEGMKFLDREKELKKAAPPKPIT